MSWAGGFVLFSLLRSRVEDAKTGVVALLSSGGGAMTLLFVAGSCAPTPPIPVMRAAHPELRTAAATHIAMHMLALSSASPPPRTWMGGASASAF